MRPLFIIIFAMFMAIACAGMGGKTVAVNHKRDSSKMLSKCTPWHVKMHGKNFDYKRAFCYAWKNRDKKGRPTKNKKGEEVWHIKYYDVVEHHQMFVDRGVWVPIK